MDLWQSQDFLEQMIQENKDNVELMKELLLSYRNLMDKRSEIDIQWLKSDTDIRKEYDKNNTERYKTDADVHKSEYKDNTDFNKANLQSNTNNRP